MPALFTFTLGQDGEIHPHESIYTESNVIDMTLLPDQTSVVYSMDICHEAFSTDATTDNEPSDPRSLMGSLSYCRDSKTWKANDSLQAKLVGATRECADSNLNAPQVTAAKGKSFTELFYGLESLRKRGSENSEIDV